MSIVDEHLDRFARTAPGGNLHRRRTLVAVARLHQRRCFQQVCKHQICLVVFAKLEKYLLLARRRLVCAAATASTAYTAAATTTAAAAAAASAYEVR